MKKLMLAALCLVLTGCSSGERPAPSSFDTASSVRFDFTDREGFTDQGAVYLDGDILHFADAESGLDTVICPKADCKHEGESHENPHPTCNGWVEGINTTCPMLTNGHLYFLYTPDMKNGGYSGFGVKKLCRADKDGTNRQDIAELDDAQLEDNFNTDDTLRRKWIGQEVAKRAGGVDSYGSPDTDYGVIYERKRNYTDLAQDILIQVEKKKAKDAGDKERYKALDSAQFFYWLTF